jgi:UDP-N-acetylglucosamine 2-epimerase (non-hydrolysing)
MKVLVPVGTRPEIVKLSPVVAALRAAGLSTVVVSTGQHYDRALSDDILHELCLEPDVRWALTGTEAERIGQMLQSAFEVVATHRPDMVLLLGDTYTVPLFCLAARRARTPVVHLEAGLRSHNPTSMEEADRLVAGALASLHLAPTELAAKFLRDAGVDETRIHVVGNPIIDVLRMSGHTAVPLDAREGVVVTAHRATNVDDPARLRMLVDLLERLSDGMGPVTFPIHPRTRARLEEEGLLERLDSGMVRTLEPLPWKTMLGYIAQARVVVTDSGGLQEEASYFGVPVVVLRRSTPRWEGVLAGTSTLTGLDVERAVTAVEAYSRPEAQARVSSTPCPYGDGRTSERVVQLLSDPSARGALELVEPDYVDRPPPC